MKRCWTCGQPIAKHNPFDDDARTIRLPEGGTVRLTPTQWTILETLRRHEGKFVSADRIVQALYADRQDGGPDYAVPIVRVMISRLRQVLPKVDYQIVNGHGHGYRLVRNEGE